MLSTKLRQRTGHFFRNSEAVSDGGLKDSRAQSFFAVFITWNCSDESTSVWLGCTPQVRECQLGQPNKCASFHRTQKKHLAERYWAGRLAGGVQFCSFATFWGFMPARMISQ